MKTSMIDALIKAIFEDEECVDLLEDGKLEFNLREIGEHFENFKRLDIDSRTTEYIHKLNIEIEYLVSEIEFQACFIGFHKGFLMGASLIKNI
ncbi:hypothetical protein [Sinanaerobacter sp. ZZT-01]|uniref:hypothetical protein n=1 Tax=Sinanaerobacter sp. ZZT-01 TaxID=3111540 RepID=UPI002D7A0C9A|nr:hypothetical protein [Sinanaerobacter sp. ZZT-01]WRR92475.1 hypothetical protein U5921_10470 [Sinanaerobacter sp. ZZT-01]